MEAEPPRDTREARICRKRQVLAEQVMVALNVTPQVAARLLFWRWLVACRDHENCDRVERRGAWETMMDARHGDRGQDGQ